jgi:hypothetical protein
VSLALLGVVAYRLAGRAGVLLVLLFLALAVVRSRARTTWTATRFSPAGWLVLAIGWATFGVLGAVAAGGAGGAAFLVLCLVLTVTCMSQASGSAERRR